MLSAKEPEPLMTNLELLKGSDARLWAWLSGRLPASGVTGADGLQPGLLA